MPTESNIGLSPVIGQRATINPYRHAAAIVWQRLRWDLHPQSWSSRRRLRGWKDRYKGQRALIVCNGPSLKGVDFGRLTGVYCLGLNKINLLFDKTPWRPSCIVAYNDLVIEQNADFYNTTELPLFLGHRALGKVRARDNVIFLHGSEQDKLARDCSVSINLAYTVTAVAMQLAFHMGFSDVALIGCDHSFAASGPPNATVLSGSEDQNHFDPSYFAGGVKWQLPDLKASEYFYHRAREMYEACGRRLWNCTDGGKLEILPRRPLGDWLKGVKP